MSAISEKNPLPIKHTDETPVPEYYDGTKPFEPVMTPTLEGEAAPLNANGCNGKTFGQRVHTIALKAAVPLNNFATRMGSESFLPAPMDKECEKAARILKAFCKDGIYSDVSPASRPAAGAAENKTLLTIPSSVIARAHGLAIFTTVRAGFHVSGATGSGVLVGRLPDGSWSAPSAFQVHSLGAGFTFGIDVYDAVVVINTQEALDAFARPTRLALGPDMAVVAGPYGAGAGVEFAIPHEHHQQHCHQHRHHAAQEAVPAPAPAEAEIPAVDAQTGSTLAAAPALPPKKPSPLQEAFRRPVYSYVKSRGLYLGIQLDGTVFSERRAANEAFYGFAPMPGMEALNVAHILKGAVPSDHVPVAARELLDVVTGAEGVHVGSFEKQPMAAAPESTREDPQVPGKKI